MRNCRIHIFGASGSGTTTLGQALSKTLGVPFFDADDYYWENVDPPFTVKRSVDRRLELLESDLQDNGRWILSGSLSKWGSALIPKFTLAVLLRLETEKRIARLRQRESRRFGSRIEPGGDMHETHTDFIEWARSYDEAGIAVRSLNQHLSWLRFLTCPVLILSTEVPVELACRQVVRALHS